MRAHLAAPLAGSGHCLRFDQWILDTRRRELLDPKGVVVDLSTGEYNLLLTFLEAPQRVLTREHLMDSAKHRMATGFDRAIDIQVSRLRRKIDSGEDGQAMIKSIRGTGRGVPNVRRVCRVTGSCALNRRHKHVAVEVRERFFALAAEPRTELEKRN